MSIFPRHPNWPEAQLRRGDTDTDTQTAHDYLCRAQQKAQPWALARGHRAVALTCLQPAEQCALFEKALHWHAQSLDLFEEARTRLAFGEALRRNHSRVAARPHLRQARRPAVDRHRRARARCDRRARPARADRLPDRPHRTRTAHRADTRRRQDNTGNRCRAVSQPQDRRVPPAPRVPETTHRFSQRTS
jgi:hypothetical protein